MPPQEQETEGIVCFVLLLLANDNSVVLRSLFRPGGAQHLLQADPGVSQFYCARTQDGIHALSYHYLQSRAGTPSLGPKRTQRRTRPSETREHPPVLRASRLVATAQQHRQQKHSIQHDCLEQHEPRSSIYERPRKPQKMPGTVVVGPDVRGRSREDHRGTTAATTTERRRRICGIQQ